MPKLNGGQEAILKTVRGLSCTRGCGTYHSQKNDSTSNEKKRVITKQGDVIFEPWPRKSRNLFPSLAFLSSFVSNHESPLFSILPIYLGTSAAYKLPAHKPSTPSLDHSTLYLRPLLIPSNRDRLVIPRKLLSPKPQLKSQISRRNDDPDIKLADIEFVSPLETRSPFILMHQFLLLHAVEVAADFAKLGRAACDRHSFSASCMRYLCRMN